MSHTDKLITLGFCISMTIFILLWFIDGGTVVTFIGAVLAIGVMVWLSRLTLDNDE
jgi:hypothetical protein